MDTDLIKLAEYFADEEKAIDFLEKIRWPEGPVCPHCGHDKAYHLKAKPGTKTRGKRKLWKCAKCRKQFSVLVGTVFSESHIPLNKWLAAFYLMCSSKKGISAKQLERSLDITYKSAWFLAHRIRHAMEQEPLKGKLSGIIEADETYIGGRDKGGRGRGSTNKTPVFSLIQRDGEARSFVPENAKASTLQPIIRANVEGTAEIMTDEWSGYRGLGKHFKRHGTVQHSKKEYVRGVIHTNFAESYFSLLKRGIVGTFHNVSAHHLQRYLNEFDFRWNHRGMSDGQRTLRAIEGIEGKRLIYKSPRSKKGK